MLGILLLLKHRRRKVSIPIILLAITLIPLGSTSIVSFEDTYPDKLVVAAVSEPLASVIREIGGDKVEVITLVPSNVDPHDYEPSMNALVDALSKARLVVATARLHFPVEEKIYQVIEEGLVNIRIIGFEDYVKNGLIPLENPITNDINLHDYYYSINGLKAIASTLTLSLAEIDPENSDYYQTRMLKYLEYIDRIEKSIESLITRRYKVIIYTPILQYLVESLDLELVDIVVSEHGVELSEKDVSDLLNKLRNGEADFILFSDEEAMRNPKLINLLFNERLNYLIIPIGSLSTTPELIPIATAVLLSSETSITIGEGSSHESQTLLLLSIIANVILIVIVTFLVLKVKKIGK